HLHTLPRRPSVALRASVPSELEDIVLACLEKRPEDRPSGARELRQQLEACELAGRWTAERAIEWWRTHAVDAPTSEAPSVTGQTLALDVTGRTVGLSAAR